MSDLYLGLDCSTQSLTAILIDDSNIVYRKSVIFDKDLPHYRTKNGVIKSNDKKVVHSYPLLWVEALDLLFGIMKDEGVNFSYVKVVSGSGQQHGTVYLNNTFEEKLKNLNPYETMNYQLGRCFSRKTSPIWMDSSTSKQCNEIRNILGGIKETIKITGSNTFERFSGPQIRKFYQEHPKNYDQTVIIHLVSSFMASILIGKNAPIDHGDGAGMNLMNINTKEWDKRALNATAPHLLEKLPPLVNSFDIIGNLAPYFVKRYTFSEEAKVVAWSGDNPNSLIGTGLIEKGKAAISLGTSDTYFGYLKKLKLDLSGEGHVFSAPTGDYMSLICHKNGSLARESIKNKFNLDWDTFSESLVRTPPGNHGKIMLPYFFPEIVPLVLEPKVFRFGLEEDDVDGNIRAIIEAQFLSMRFHSQWTEKPEIIHATGGASQNRAILQVAADIFNVKIKTFEIPNSAALGAALRAYHAAKDKLWADIIALFLKFDDSNILIPRNEFKELYEDMILLYSKYEDYILRNGEDPENLRLDFIKKYYKT
ncbi:MAG: xylulokinase [Promethearchaeota archaeon]